MQNTFREKVEICVELLRVLRMTDLKDPRKQKQKSPSDLVKYCKELR